MPPIKQLMPAVPGWSHLLMAFLALGACGSLTPVSPPVVDQLNLAALSAEVDAGAFGRIAAVVVSQGGTVVFEDYFASQSPDGLVDMRSAGKSLTAIAAGIAIEEGLISGVDAPVISVFADRAPIALDGEIKRSIVLRDLLTMRSALDCNDWRPSPGNEERMYRTRDWTRFALDLPVDPRASAAAGGASRFSYCTAGVFLIGQMIERESAERFDRYVASRVFDQIGVTDVEWTRSPSGEIQSGGQLGLRARDAERIGRLVLNEGRWGGQQIVPAAWIAEMVTPASWPRQDLSYGYLWWRGEFRVGASVRTVDTIMMMGNGGNIVAVIPEYDAVVVVQSRNYNTPGDFERSRDLIERFVLDGLADRDARTR
ncbi:serine hydrolase domain-containing protein [Primorskyibacter sp. S187A]|uniref:serine hydrolase domain-containing protein n=1 Tax=Primorskyibacter sp. S187A TaxID=3415130 RepID=UPI003C7B7682